MKNSDLEHVRDTLEKLQEELFLAERNRNQGIKEPKQKPVPAVLSLQAALARLKRAAKNMDD